MSFQATDLFKVKLVFGERGNRIYLPRMEGLKELVMILVRWMFVLQ